MLRVPAGSDDELRLAVPPEVMALPIVLLPLKNVTVIPFGTGPRTEEIVAVKVTAWPTGEGFSELVTTVFEGTFVLNRTDAAPLEQLVGVMHALTTAKSG